MTTDTTDDDRAVPAEGSALSGPEAAPVLDALQHQLAVYARRAEQTRLGGLGQARNSMDRAAYLLLNRLDQEGPMGVKALAAGMGIDSSTVTRQVAPLVESGLVKRTSHPEDGRAVVLQLSPRGHSRLEEVRSSRRQLMELITEGWTAEERGTFCELLTRFNTAMLGLNPASLAQPPQPPAASGQDAPAS
ncbi:MarR family transcriptional regulator [Streptomyces sp. NBC_01795]|nr:MULTISPECIES: MarR family transcriptional regulator [unclassified Streptomyces]WSA92704.1 MarR family transcriptional regulator [Streptomyces sp. NBC_01795]WSB77075.1 MarR family transcriptional regulator [Streptomyces sp. NBC_01775]WSS14658.1 MarR family transcriptional regulator [Streptomyces sp. NBC_01186]WSS43472.1 MarR family transcriptional regulator [Streptomyces sp. NBC_01187]